MQHCFGAPGSGGPIGALERLQAESRPEYPSVIQRSAAKGIDVRLIARFVREIRCVRPRLIHVRGLGNEGFHGALAARIAGVPNILVSVHGSQRDLLTPRSSLRRWFVVNVLERITLMLATHVATVYEGALERDFIRGVKHKIAGVVPNGVPMAPLPDAEQRYLLRERLGLGRASVVGVCVARLVPDKGFHVLARALRRMGKLRPDFELLIVGGGDSTGEIRRDLGSIPGVAVHFIGQQRDVMPFLLASDIFIQASLHENLSNALLEAMACGLPAVATSVGGTVEVISRGGGVLVPPGDVDPLGEAIRGLVKSPALRARLGREARTVIEQHYSIRSMVDGWTGIYERILGLNA